MNSNSLQAIRTKDNIVSKENETLSSIWRGSATVCPKYKVKSLCVSVFTNQKVGDRTIYSCPQLSEIISQA